MSNTNASDGTRATPDPIPRVAYTARSKDEEPGKDSTGDQLAILRERFGPFAAEYTDHASGYSGNRGEGLARAMAHAARLAAEHGRAELCVFKSERLARGSAQRRGRAVETGQPLVSSLARKGTPWGPSPRYGYRWAEASEADLLDGRRHGRYWRVDPAEAAIVRRIYRERTDEGRAYSEIARIPQRGRRRVSDEPDVGGRGRRDGAQVQPRPGRKDEARSVMEVYVEMRRAGVDLRARAGLR